MLEVSAPAEALGVAHGAHLRPVYISYGNGTWYSYGNEILGFNSVAGKDLAVVMYFAAWAPFDPFLLNEINRLVPLARRPVIMLTWGPGKAGTGCDLGFGNGGGPLRAITSGQCDDFIRGYARSLKARPERFILRLAHEMNISDTDWSPARWGQDASAYVGMYRHVRGIFRAEGASNVEWMWSPNYASYPADAWNDINNYYPGDTEVDWIGLSGFNWYGFLNQPWRDFSFLYDSVLRDLGCRYAKPVILSEIGSVPGPTEASKASWITDAYLRLPDYPFVRGIIWFNDFAFASRGQADFRISTGGADCQAYHDCTGVAALPGSAGQRATDAYVTSVRPGIYTSKLPALSQATPPFTLCNAPPQQFSLSADVVFVGPGAAASTTVRGFLYSSASQITIGMPPGIHGTASPSAMPPPWGTSTVKLTIDANLAPGAYEGTIAVGSTSLPISIRVSKARVYLPSVRR